MKANGEKRPTKVLQQIKVQSLRESKTGAKRKARRKLQTFSIIKPNKDVDVLSGLSLCHYHHIITAWLLFIKLNWRRGVLMNGCVQADLLSGLYLGGMSTKTDDPLLTWLALIKGSALNFTFIFQKQLAVGSIKISLVSFVLLLFIFLIILCCCSCCCPFLKCHCQRVLWKVLVWLKAIRGIGNLF